MGDSEDEHERSRSRDKFRRERNDYGSSDKGRSSRSDSYRDRRTAGTWRDDRRRDRNEYESDSRRRHSSSSGYGRGPGGSGRDWSPPPAKRMRRENWDSLRDYPPGPGMMSPYGMRPPWPMPPPGPHTQVPPLLPGIPRESTASVPGSQGAARHMMLTFKQFLAQQDDSIDGTDAIESYNEYKCEFKQKQVQEFFEKHKGEDWFMSLYHPVNLAAAKELEFAHLRWRVQAHLFLMGSGRLEQVSLSVLHAEEIIKTMDAAVIKMEGGSDADLQTLEEQEEGEEEEGEEKTDLAKDGNPPSFMGEPSKEDIRLAEKAKQYSMMKKGGEGRNEGGGVEDMDRTPPPVDGGSSVPENTDERANGQAEEKKDAGPRPLHLTRSVYIRHIPPKISADDIVKVCKTLPGFLRIAFAEATADKGYERRGWVTYTHETDIKDVSAQLSAMKVRECQLACTINRDLTRRVKHAPPSSWARKAVHSDLHLAIKLIDFLDKKKQLWQYATEGEEMTNPVLAIEESLLHKEEEAEPVAMAVGDDEEGAIGGLSGSDILEENDKKLKTLERLLWYLRLVHSLDYYNALFFTSEDSMPHRCGIFTVRSRPPPSVTQDDLSKYCEEIEGKIEPLLANKKELSDSEMEKFGQKDPASEALKFVELNTQKMSENKYLCPLSGKKFKGPEFVKKHIYNKHMDKVDAVKKEAEFFNNYIRDVDRPMPLEASLKAAILPPNPKTPSADDSSPSLGVIPPLGAQSPGVNTSVWGQDPMHMFSRGGYGDMRGVSGYHSLPDRGLRSRGGRRGQRRRVVDYLDLDQPDDVDVY